MTTKKIHTTNYFDTFIEVAEDCPVSQSEIPVSKGGKPTIATIQYDLISKNPYQWTSDDVIFQHYVSKNDLTESEYPQAKTEFFSKGQACLRTSPLAKRYGFGIHSNKDGKIAIYGVETEEYQKLKNDMNVKKVKAMRSSKK